MISETVVSCSETQSLLRTALVIRYSMNRAEVVIDGEIRTALRTTGCGVDPRVGDRVVLFFPKGEIPLILSIIEGGSSSHSSPRTMSFPEGLVLEVSGHPFSLRSREGAEVDSPEICLRGQRMTGEFAECEIVSGRMTLTGGVLSFLGEKIGQVAKTIERVSEWLHDRAHGSIREIDTLDQHLSGETMIESSSIVSIQAKTALVATDDLVKIDSDQIHLG